MTWYCYLLFLCLVRDVATVDDKDCPCVFNITTKAADCTGHYLETAWKIPDCVPNDTTRLNFSHNDLLYESGQFLRFKALTNLDLSWNPSFTPANDSFSGLRKLQVLYLKDTNLYNEFRTKLFTEPTSVQVLSFRESVLTYLPVDFFSNLRYLVSLDLSQNYLTVLENGLFKDLSNLRHLNIEGNWRLAINHHIIDGLSRLEALDLSGCGLKTIREDLFSDLYMLKDLDLAYNFVTSLEANRFRNLSNLVHLDLSGNGIHNLSERSFNGLSGLKKLSLQSNDLEIEVAAAIDIFHPLKSLESLVLANGLSNTVDLEVFPLLFKPLQSLKHLDLSENKIKELPRDTFFITTPAKTPVSGRKCSTKCIL